MPNDCSQFVQTSSTPLVSRRWPSCKEMTPRSVALGAARLLLQQQLWKEATYRGQALGRLSLLDSLCLAAGGGFTADGVPAAPEEPEAAAVLATTCGLLAAGMAKLPAAASVAEPRLDQLRPVSLEDAASIQWLLATVHNAPAAATGQSFER